jgi:hypothetical protein
VIKVFINGDFAMDGVRIWIVNETPSDINGPAKRWVYHRDGNNISWDEAETGVLVEPTMTLQDDIARALHEELTRHYHGADDSRALRRDYDAERARVDKLTGAIIDFLRPNRVTFGGAGGSSSFGGTTAHGGSGGAGGR